MLVRGGLATAAVALTAMALGGGTALADTPTPDHANSAICTQRIPAVLARIDKLTARVNGDASVPGSTAWLRAKANEARAATRRSRTCSPRGRTAGQAASTS